MFYSIVMSMVYPAGGHIIDPDKSKPLELSSIEKAILNGIAWLLFPVMSLHTMLLDDPNFFGLTGFIFGILYFYAISCLLVSLFNYIQGKVSKK
jgi:hypothetical protein